MSRRLAPVVVFLAVLVPAAASAQINLDQNKTPATMFTSNCAVCHKSMRGLANGRGADRLTSFLSEHYTSSRQQAAALAAYVLAGGGGEGKPAPVRQRPEPAHANAAAAEEPEAVNHGRHKREEPTAARGSGKHKPAEEARGVASANAGEEPGTAAPAENARSAHGTAGNAGRQQRGRKPKEPERGQATASATPAAAEPPHQPPVPPETATVNAPPEAEPAEAPPGPRDDIPD